MKYDEIVNGVFGDRWIAILDQYLAEVQEQKGNRQEAIDHVKSNLHYAAWRMDDSAKSQMFNRRIRAWLAARENNQDCVSANSWFERGCR